MSNKHDSTSVKVLECGLLDYHTTWQAMQDFNAAQADGTMDEIWLLQHPPVYTHGLNCKDQDIRDRADIPSVSCDRGGETTYHGPGQLIAYILMNINARGWGVKKLVTALEQSVIDLLHGYGIQAERQVDAPGVYVDSKKIAALGLRIKRGCSYHGIALNGQMDLMPFHDINPCGYPGLNVTQMADLIENYKEAQVQKEFLTTLLKNLGYNKVIHEQCTLSPYG